MWVFRHEELGMPDIVEDLGCDLKRGAVLSVACRTTRKLDAEGYDVLLRSGPADCSVHLDKRHRRKTQPKPEA